MTLKQLLKNVETISIKGSLDSEICGMAFDSRKVKDEYAFICYEGVNQDLHDYIPDAIKRGAKAIISERKENTRKARSMDDKDLSVVQVPDGREALALIASNWYGNPASQLKIIGITGTNGKTSTVQMLKSIFSEAGIQPAVFGTIGYEYRDRFIPASTTTPDPIILHRSFRDFVDAGCVYAVMEATSQGLAQKRLTGIQFETAVFTNLTQDHLDYHKTMQNYLDAKAILFHQLIDDGVAILNADEPASEKIRDRLDGVRIMTYGIENPAELQVKNVRSDMTELTFTAVIPEGEFGSLLKVLGEYNIYNALAAIGVSLVYKIDIDKIQSGLKKAKVPGRFELVNRGQDFAVIVDYAHTPDALDNLLKAARKITKNRLICVFGCGGDRDKTKRPIMGQIATTIADHTIVTSDNPRTEAPDQIVVDIVEGIDKSADYETIVDRSSAIGRAIEIAQPNDVVVIAGKGHEDYQIFKDKRIHFDDREEAAKYLNRKLK